MPAGQRIQPDLIGLIGGNGWLTDALNRMTHAVFASGTPIAFTYDGGKHPEPNDIGHLTHISDESGQTRWRFNGFGNVVRKTQSTTANGETKKQVVAYAYGTSGSSTGHVTSMTYPSSSVIGYSYDAGGRIAGLTLTTAHGSVALLSNIQYQPFGKPAGWTWGNGTAYTRSFDLSGRLTQFPLGATSGTGATPNGLSRTVNYDAASRITAYTHADTSGSTGSSTATAANQTFGYDDQDRLISYLPGSSSQSYSYDANGNRTGQTIGGASYTQTIDPKSNRQTASTGPSATRNSYDAAGNQTGDGTTTYSYSDRGRLASVTKNGITTSYLYNGLEQRVVKSGSNVPTGATRYVYDEAGHLIGEYDQSGNAIQETVYLGDTPIATLKNGTPYYIYADQIDTPRVITDTNNLMVWRWDQTDPFGAMLPDENPTGLGVFTYNLRFPGQIYDQETGKHYNVNRDYDPAGGRYVQSDPIGLNGGQVSTYSYVNGNPLSYIDPRGLDTTVVCRPVNDAKARLFGAKHCFVMVWHWEEKCGKRTKVVDGQYSLAGNRTVYRQNSPAPTYRDDTSAWNNGSPAESYPVPPPMGQSSGDFDRSVGKAAEQYKSDVDYNAVTGPNSNTAARQIVERAGGSLPHIPGAYGQYGASPQPAPDWTGIYP
uniref:Teneurin-like YD-shell domain-containing protein n=1 Tax=Ralstonia solanacearum CFBP2957 TaxID=859656 RepID=D8P2Z2_RALSL|nr:protein of unknown function [Ralstonia solanacearum CFBP2957]